MYRQTVSVFMLMNIIKCQDYMQVLNVKYVVQTRDNL